MTVFLIPEVLFIKIVLPADQRNFESGGFNQIIGPLNETRGCVL